MKAWAVRFGWWLGLWVAALVVAFGCIWFLVKTRVVSAPSGVVARVGSVRTVIVRIATYNVRNYLSTNRIVDGQYKTDWPKPEAEKTALRAVIRQAHPDVLALEEMGDAKELEELRRDLAAEGADYPYSALVSAADPDRHVAVLSRVPFAKVQKYEDVEYKLGQGSEKVKRGLLEADFVTAGQAWAFYAVHLKSRLNEEGDPNDPLSANRREGEAHALRDLIRKQQPLLAGALVAVVGDFNDTRDSVPLRRFLELDGKPLLHLVPAADSRGQTWTFTYPHADTYERIDFVLLSAALLPWQKDAGTVVDIPESEQASDHRLVWVDLAFPAGPDEPAAKGP
jgi:endonuclease/exonuclease/phosphatase family metal-dependent hydrolase